MGTVFKVLLFVFIIYMVYTWLRGVFAPPQRRSNAQRDVRIFKKGEVEKSKLDVHDAETVEFEEIEEKTPQENKP